MTLDLASTAFLAQMAGMGAPPFTEMSAQDARAAVADLAELYGEGPDMASSHDVSVPTADGDTIGARVLTPHGGGRAVLVYFHGGGWVFGDIDGYETVGRLLAEKTRSVVVLVDYRKAPEHPYPTAPNDAWDALTWVDANMASLVGKRLPIVVAGDSAGGNLAAVVAQKAKAAGGPDIALQVLVYPVTDAAMDTESCADPACQLLLSTELMAWFWNHYAPDPDDRSKPDASPLRAEDVSGLPPAVVVTAEFDPLRDEGEAYAHRLQAAGVPTTLKRFDRQMHNFFAMPNVLPAAEKGMAYVAEQMDRHLAVASLADAVVVGAGFAGMYQLHKLRALGLSTRVIEAGDDVGGTWYWNRYPGARCDIESMAYSYGFSPELEQDWSWSEKYATQPEILRYAQHVADRFDLKRDITFNTRVTRARYDEDTSRWTVYTDQGEAISASYLIMATGCLSVPKVPDIPGADTFEGPTYVTGRWPHEGVDFTGKTVAVIGTGSSGIQSIPLIAEQAAEMRVYQRTPAYSQPAGNRPLTNAEVSDMKGHYRDYRVAQRHQTPAGIPNPPRVFDRTFDVSKEERLRRYEEAWESGLLTALSGAFADVFQTEEANHEVAEFIRDKVRAIVKDPVKAEILAPKSYPFATKRPCLDSGYYETFNRDTVHLTDLRETPIESITATGIRTRDGEETFDAIVFATGFDAMTGALLNVEIEGAGGLRLADKWKDGPRSYLGIAVAGFPNLFTITGPSSPSVLSNMLVSIEQHVDWVTDCIGWQRANGIAALNATEPAEDEWALHSEMVANQTLFPQADSWYVGANVPGKPRTFMAYIGGVDVYRVICDQVAAAGYDGFDRIQAPVAPMPLAAE